MKVKFTGLNTVGLLIIVFAIGLAGALIWTAVSRENISRDQTDATVDKTDQTDEESDKDSETANWNTETVARYGISFKYPSDDGWKSTLGITDSLTPGHEASIGVNYTKCGPNCGYALSIGVFYKEFEAGSQKDFSDEAMNGNDYYSLKSKGGVTIDGVSGTRWEYSPGDSSAAAIVYYYFSANDFSYMFTVNSNGAVTDAVDLTATGEKIVETVRFTK